MSAHDQLIPLLKRMRLSGLLQTADLRIEQAVEDRLDHWEFLFRLFNDEAERRDAGLLHRRIKHAAFEGEKTLETFDFAFNPQIPKATIIDLATCRFMGRRENVLLIGPSGVGKSHIAQALGHRACRIGKKVLYTSANQMLTQLRAARADATLEKQLHRFTAPDLLIIDDLGLRPLAYEEPLDLYEIIRRRYEKASTILTSNRDITEWYALFGDSLLASAAMDRLLHHANTITLTGDSYRNPKKKKK